MSTTVSILNLTSAPLDLVTGVTPPLQANYYSILASTVGMNVGSVPVLTFDRNDGITDKDTWTFSTQTNVAGLAVNLQERVTGTFAGSTMAQCITVGTAGTGFVDTNAPESVTASNSSGTPYTVGWSLTLNSSGYYDILYTVSQG